MILVSKKIKYTEAELSFEKDVDGLVTFDGERIRPDDVEDSDASAAPEATPSPSVLASMKRVKNGNFVDALHGDSDASAAPEAKLEPYDELCSHLPCADDQQDKLSVSPGILNGARVMALGRGDVWISDAEQWARFANEVFALLGGEFVVARKVSNDNS